MAGLNTWATGKKGFQHAPLHLGTLATIKIGVTFGNNTFVAVCTSGYILRSTDNGTNWDSRISVNPFGTSERFDSVAF